MAKEKKAQLKKKKLAGDAEDEGKEYTDLLINDTYGFFTYE